ncbi:pathogenesis-related homeodomain protein-like [Rutidosis leptorrhynchoides]|uniref:pathogenesis-related homeodomain protein-like n=1 Tax=Rutidosis leptorrhynchoides TaxID=125765 RepID=UPI003A99A628
MDLSAQEHVLRNGKCLTNRQSDLIPEGKADCACHDNMETHKNIELMNGTVVAEPKYSTGIYSTPTKLGRLPEDTSKCSSQQGKRKREQPRKDKINVTASSRVLRSRSQEKPKIPESIEAPSQDAASKERRRRKMKKIKKDQDDEFSKIKKHLRYLLNRMSYEQNFIEAYAGEGWKGQSLEKLRPEKELERAKSDINRYKLRIRDLFQRIDTSCEEGRIPESLYDSDGLIDSEDIFCAKCGQSDVRLDNDIILCDGACDRGFHQFCLVPPLLKEHVPPGDEGWLCPACECKVDCFDLLNDSQGTNLCIEDNWEKVFPESVATGNKLEDNSELLSDDSGDDDYNPDGPEVEDELDADADADPDADADDSSSDDSDFSSASEDLAAVTNNEQFLGLPSEDSDDDDFNPDKADSDEEAKTKSSSSDFSSDFDDLRDITKNEVLSSEVEEPLMSEIKEEIPDTNIEDDDFGPITAKRHVERLNYKKLHDETYGNVSSDSSDEDFTESEAPSRRKNAKGSNDTKVTKERKENGSTPVRTSKKIDGDGSNNSVADNVSTDKSATKSSYKKRIGEAAAQRLYESFKENHYPDRTVRYSLAKELNLTHIQISKWFGNARWSSNHPEGRTKLVKSPSKSAKKSKTEQTIESSFTTPKSKEKKLEADNHDADITPSLKEASPKYASGQTTRRSGRVQAKRQISEPQL